MFIDVYQNCQYHITRMLAGRYHIMNTAVLGIFFNKKIVKNELLSACVIKLPTVFYAD
jgi:hypothetical protein